MFYTKEKYLGSIQKILFLSKDIFVYISDYYKTPTVIYQLKDASNAVYYPAGHSNVKYRPAKPLVSDIDQRSLQCQISTREAFSLRYRPEERSVLDNDQQNLPMSDIIQNDFECQISK